MREIKINSTDGSEIVLVATAKDYMRVSSTVDDNIITRMITQLESGVKIIYLGIL